MGEKYLVQCPMFKEQFEEPNKYIMDNDSKNRFRALNDSDLKNKYKLYVIKNPGRRFVINRRLDSSLLLATKVIDKLACDMYAPEECHWQKTLLGHTFTMSRGPCAEVCDSGTKTVITAFKSWLQAHEEAQVMLASVLVVVGVWWLVRAVLALLINLLCPILVVLLAVVCVPQLRAPLLGQNYPVVANLMRNILMKMADNIKT